MWRLYETAIGPKILDLVTGTGGLASRLSLHIANPKTLRQVYISLSVPARAVHCPSLAPRRLPCFAPAQVPPWAGVTAQTSSLGSRGRSVGVRVGVREETTSVRICCNVQRVQTLYIERVARFRRLAARRRCNWRESTRSDLFIS